MNYLKCFLVGLAASFSAVILFPFVVATLTSTHRPPGRDGAISWDLRSALGSPVFVWCYGLTVVIFFGTSEREQRDVESVGCEAIGCWTGSQINPQHRAGAGGGRCLVRQ
jgi:hypothetical protein